MLGAAVLAQQRWRRQLGAAAMASVGQTLVAEHAWQSGNAGDLQFAAGVLIEVTSLAPGSGWITGRLADGTTGIFPSNFVRTNGPVDSATRARSATAPESSAASDGGSAGRQRSGSAHPAGGSPSAPMHYVAAHAFDPQGQAGCIALAAGEAVVVTDNSREDWWQGFRTAEPGKLGSFPKAYVQPAPAAAAVAAPASDSGAQAALRAEELERKAKLEEWAAKQAAEAEAEEQKAVADAAKRAEQAEQAERVEAPAVTGGAASAEETGWIQKHSDEHGRRYAASSPTSTSHACWCFKQTCLLRTARAVIGKAQGQRGVHAAATSRGRNLRTARRRGNKASTRSMDVRTGSTLSRRSRLGAAPRHR